MTHLVVITGTSRGIGAGIASAASASATAGDSTTDSTTVVAVCNRSAVGAEHELVVDLAEPAAWAGFASWLDGLVDTVSPERLTVIHNAATLQPIGFAGEVDPAAYTMNVLINSAAPQVLGDAVIRTAHRVGVPTTLIQLSSGAGKNPYPGWSSYCASKAAVDMWVRTAAVEQGDRHDLVRVGAISPGVVDTGMQADIRGSDTTAFPNVERFRDLKSDEQLADPAEVGARIWAASQSTIWPNGVVADISQL